MRKIKVVLVCDRCKRELVIPEGSLYPSSWGTLVFMPIDGVGGGTISTISSGRDVDRTAAQPELCGLCLLSLGTFLKGHPVAEVAVKADTDG